MSNNDLLELVRQQKEYIVQLEKRNAELTAALDNIQNKVMSLYDSYACKLNSNPYGGCK